jgi:hypothetical protein
MTLPFRLRTRRFSAALLLAASACTGAPRLAPVPEEAPFAAVQHLDAPPCTAVPRREGEVIARYECAGSDASAAIRISAGLPAGWEPAVQQQNDILLLATRGPASMFIRGGDQLPEPLTATDSAEYWNSATELMLGHAPTPREVREMRQDAGDEAGARFMVSREQRTDPVLLEMTGSLSAAAQGRTVHRQVLDVRTLSGEPAGHLFEVSDREGAVWHYEAYVAIVDAVFYVVAYTAPEADFTASQALWEQALAAFALHPPER